MTLTTKYLNFWTRIEKGIFRRILIVSLIILYNYFTDKRDFGLFGLMILGFGIIYMVISVINAWTFVNEVKVTDDKIIVTGTNMDTRWDKEFNIKDSEIKIKSKGRGRGNVEYYLRLSSRDKSVDINRSFNWEYQSLLTIFHEFKKLKGEKIIFDEKHFLDIMEKKANGFSMMDIASGKELRK